MNAKFMAAKMPVATQHSFKLDFYSWDLISIGKILILSYLYCWFSKKNTHQQPSLSRCQEEAINSPVTQQQSISQLCGK